MRTARLAGEPVRADNDQVNVVVLEVRRGRDGKLYPPRPVVPDRDHWRTIRLAHELVHGRGLSIRRAQAVMLADHGVRRSVGQLHNDLRGFTCPRCEDEP